MLRYIYDRWILEYPRVILILILAALAGLSYEARNLDIDASAETLILENDRDLRLTRLVAERYSSPEFLFITYSPRAGNLLDDRTLAIIKGLREDLKLIDGVDSVISILDVPLLESPSLPVREMLKNIRTLESPETDRELARRELLTSPIYRDLIVNSNFSTTALQVNLREDRVFRNLLNRRNELKERSKSGEMPHKERLELDSVLTQFKAHRDAMRARQHETVRQVRAVMDGYRGEANLFLGGVAMVADDLISFIRSDLEVFGAGVVLLLMVTLWIIFRQIRWLLIPLLCCLLSVAVTCGILGFFGWEVTVISSNFISLQLIITMSGSIHIIVRYRELLAEDPSAEHRQLILNTVLSIDKPSLYCVLTTMAGFLSLILSGILPVINFGWMMTLGIGLSLILTFLIFPTVLMLMKKVPPSLAFESHFVLTKRIASFTEARWKMILVTAVIILLLSIAGIKRLVVENSFIDYFRHTTEIYRGMSLIDRELGGTTPIEVLIDFPPEEESFLQAASTGEGGGEEEDELEAEFEANKLKAPYWFTSRRMAEVEKVHDYLDGIREIGKVLSLGTMLKVGRNINKGADLDNFQLALIYNELPERFREIILTPYVSVENNQVRFSARVRDSEKTLRRDELVRRIRREMTDKLGIEPGRVHVTGLMVLYNNMLQSLFSSQIMTLGAVLVAIMGMLMLLFRSIRIALIAICPSLISVLSILGFMGWAGIPLDMMTITIASISVGIAIDDTIHYIHRFRREFSERGGSYIELMHLCHGSIGYAMYYTSVVIVIGFSILVLSSFIPSIYFGLLTGVAMVFALAANLTLLPGLVVLIKPFGPEREMPVKKEG